MPAPRAALWAVSAVALSVAVAIPAALIVVTAVVSVQLICGSSTGVIVRDRLFDDPNPIRLSLPLRTYLAGFQILMIFSVLPEETAPAVVPPDSVLGIAELRTLVQSLPILIKAF